MALSVKGTLYTYEENYRAYKVLVAAAYSGAQVEVAKNFVFGETNKTKEFKKKFPLGKVPAFETDDGQCIVESNAIAYYVANGNLKGTTDLEKAQVIQWASYADSEILPASSGWIFPLIGIIPYEKQNVSNAKSDCFKVLSYLNDYLQNKTYFVGERITLADIFVSMNLLYLYQFVLDAPTRKPFPHLNRWFTTLMQQPQFKKVIPNFEMAATALEPDPSRYHQLQEAKPSKDKKEKKETPKEDKKKEKKEKEPVEEPDAVELALAGEPKSSNPFDSMPKGTFDMDDFKRNYSNNDVDVSIPYFWSKFDPENYSIWFCEYKYADELAKTFMSCNLISGMYQRIEKMRKAAFASMCLFGTDNDSTISGIWIWRGQELAFKLCPDWQIDYESYDWKKLDPKDSKTKETVQGYLSWECKDKNGRNFNQGKIFK